MLIPPPPPGMNYLVVIRPSLNMVIIGAAWSSALVPLLIALFLFSTEKLRKTPTFILNVLSVLVGIAAGILNYYVEVHTIMSPLQPLDTRYAIAFSTFMCLIPILVETILVVRVLIVYPLHEMSYKAIAIVYIPIVLLKIGRLTDVLVFFITFYPTVANGTLNPIVLGKKSWNSPTAKVAWTLQMVDNGYSSALFLWRLRHGISQTGRVESKNSSGKWSYISRVRSLFWIATSNFVFPFILSFVQLVFSFKDADYLHGTYIVICNAYINIIGVLFATVWSAGKRPDPPALSTREYPSIKGSSSLGPATFAPNHALNIGGFTTSGTTSSGDSVFNVTASNLERGIKMETFTETHSDEAKYDTSKI
ncbi:hypothetical protein BDZ89DRAFT_1030194 [Hymenopellis radicata]|nr:hypothetical protein BDZ89DRAFT_1030194 [Hymenopellis radicata]